VLVAIFVNSNWVSPISAVIAIQLLWPQTRFFERRNDGSLIAASMTVDQHAAIVTIPKA
jgi:hypothetical protein